MILGMWINTVIAYFLNSFYSGRLISYPMSEQLADILPAFLIASVMGAAVLLIETFLPIGTPVIMLFILILAGFVIVLAISEIFHLDAYADIKSIIKTKLIARHYGS